MVDKKTRKTGIRGKLMNTLLDKKRTFLFGTVLGVEYQLLTQNRRFLVPEKKDLFKKVPGRSLVWNINHLEKGPIFSDGPQRTQGPPNPPVGGVVPGRSFPIFWGSFFGEVRNG